jgi:zinc transport system substrate-binding protein
MQQLIHNAITLNGLRMKIFLSFILLLAAALPFSSRISLHAGETAKPTVLVSVAPHKFFIEKISGGTVNVQLMVPAGASSHTYEPTPKQIISASNADLWFCIGESFESRAIKAFKVHNTKMQAIDLRKNVDMITADPATGQCCCHANSQDLHVWLSPRQAKIQASTIATTLSSCYPEHAGLYEENLEKFHEELNALDREIESILQPVSNRVMMVSHPAYAYFCRDYNFTQLSIEFEGKDPTPRQLNRILNQAREAHIGKIFIQPQYSSKGAKLFAKELSAQVVTLDPYAEDYLNTMRQIARAIA